MIRVTCTQDHAHDAVSGTVVKSRGLRDCDGCRRCEKRIHSISHILIKDFNVVEEKRAEVSWHHAVLSFVLRRMDMAP